MSWLDKLLPSKIRTTGRRNSVPEGLWNKCPACESVLYQAELERSLQVCPKCEHHQRISARARLEGFLDEGEQIEIAANLSPVDTLKFKDSKKYKDRISQAQKNSGEKDALIVMQGTINQLPVVAAAFVQYLYVRPAVEPAVIVGSIRSIVPGSQTAAGSVIIRVGSGSTVTTTGNITEQPSGVVPIM